ncbi:hypothetical protein CR513_32823, partial [Mucuna pruriens]
MRREGCERVIDGDFGGFDVCVAEEEKHDFWKLKGGEEFDFMWLPLPFTVMGLQKKIDPCSSFSIVTCFHNKSAFSLSKSPPKIVSELFGLKDVVLGRIIEGNTNRMFKEDTSLSDHLNEFQGIIDQMSGMGIKFEDEILGLLLLNSLPESWETFKENKGKKGKSKEKDDDRATIATGDFGVLKMGNYGVTKVIDVGDVCLQTNTRMQLWLRGVKHALNIRFNLISVHMLDDDGYDNHFGHGK